MLWVFFVIVCLESARAFVPIPQHVAFKFQNGAPDNIPTALQNTIHEENESDNNAKANMHGNIRERKRREVVGTWFRKALVVGFGYKTVSTTGRSPAIAAVDDAVNGRIVSFQVQNLNGIDGKTGNIKIQLAPAWAPRGVARFEELTDLGFWDDCRFFRVLPGFVVQFGINGNPEVQSKWRIASIPDDPVRTSNERGTVVFATAGPNSRTTQLFINTRDQGNAFLDNQGFSPIGRVIEGMDVVDQMYAGYGEGAPAGQGPNQGLIQARGNSYLKENFPKLSYVISAK